jgi:phenylacetate-CoA ligase
LGNIIVTGLNNYGMPFIRYDTGDMGVLLHKNGGVVQFKKIVGRNQDYILSKDNQKVYLTALIFGQHLRAFKNIIQWQIVQNSIGLIELKIIRGKYFSQDDEFELRYNLEKSAKIDITFKYVPIIPRTKRGKHLFLIQNIKSERDDVNI